MSSFNKGIIQLVSLFFLCMISDLLIIAYIQGEGYLKKWLVVATGIFIIELFVIVNSLKIRKVLILSFGILPDHSDDHFSSAYKEGRKKAEAKGKKDKPSHDFFYLLLSVFIVAFSMQSLIRNFSFGELITAFTLVQGIPLAPTLFFFSMIIVSLLCVELVIIIYLWIFVRTLNEKQFLR